MNNIIRYGDTDINEIIIGAALDRFELS